MTVPTSLSVPFLRAVGLICQCCMYHCQLLLHKEHYITYERMDNQIWMWICSSQLSVFYLYNALRKCYSISQ
ncbi:unnamed protein product [Urochloa humidicola]